LKKKDARMNRSDISIPLLRPRSPVVTPGALGVASEPVAGSGTAPPSFEAVHASEGGTLSLGEGISVQGTIVGARRIVIGGVFDSQHLTTAELVISRTGVFRGTAEVAGAELDGRFEGTLTVNGHLAALPNCQLVGSVRYERLSVQPGGTLSGELAVLLDPMR
jgi:cytoskeletal protein CcmA (bactofilin family)